MRRACVLLYKTAVSATAGTEKGAGEQRFWELVASNHCAQLTTYNTGEQFDEEPAVHSELAATSLDEDDAGLHRDIVVVTKRESMTEHNLKTGGICSLMYGSTNPQIHHFFKQLNARCWTATLTGRGEEIPADEGGRLLFQKAFRKNAYLVNATQNKQEESSLKRVKAFKVQRRQDGELSVRDEDEDEDEEADGTAAINPDLFTVWRLKPESGFAGRPDGGLDKQSVLTIPAMDPLGAVVQRWVQRMNFRRDILIEGIRTAYNIPVQNAFVFHLNKKGFYVMGHTEDKVWQEFFLEWGPSMVFENPRQVKSWWSEFVDQAQVSYDNTHVGKPGDLTR